MKKTTILLTALCLAVVLCSNASAQNYLKQAQFVEQATSPDLLPTHIQFDASNAPVFSNNPNEINQFLGLSSTPTATLMRIETDDLGFTHYRYQQTLRGFPINEAVFIAHVQNGKLLVANGFWLNEAALQAIDRQTVDKVSEKFAFKAALKSIKATLYKWQVAEEEENLKAETGDKAATYLPKGEKVFVRFTDDWNTEGVRLAWRFDVYAQEPLSRRLIYVDAETGKVLTENQRIHEADVVGTANTAYSGVKNITSSGSGTSYVLRETTRGKGINTMNLRNTTTGSPTNFTSTSANWNLAGKDQYALDAHFGAETTYDYFKNVHNRNSIDNAGFAINSYVHYGNNFVNAFWDGSKMTYGDGSGSILPLTAMDVCGHEITHGLTEKTANLTYVNESGALNEAFSDIFGTVIEFYSNPTTYAPNWTIGERMNFTIRNMANPNQYQQPDTYKGTNWTTSSGDNGGVHTNSGVLNFWFYLLTVGKSGTNDFGFAYAVQGIGMDKAAKIAFRTLTVYLTASSNYSVARTASIQAATDLYGAASNEVAQVKNAWCAVNVVCGNQAPSVTLTSPTANARFGMGSPITLTATAIANTGTITKVEFYQGFSTLVKIGEATTAPYSFAWRNFSSGSYYLRAKATNSIGLSTTTNYTYITVRVGLFQGDGGGNTEGTALKGLGIGNAQLSPNPANRQVNLTIPSADEGTYNLSVFNALGSQVFAQNGYLQKGDNQQTLDVSTWIKGLYVVRIQSPQGDTAVKLVVD
jgi:bacillolysin